MLAGPGERTGYRRTCKGIMARSNTANRRGRRGMSRSEGIAAVRVVPPGEGQREQKVERILTQIKESQSTTRLQLKDTFFINAAAGAVVAKYSFPQVQATDDFVSLAQQFQKYRVVCLKFDVYDFVAANQNLGIIGSYHGSVNPGTQGEVTDLADSGVVPPGTGFRTWYWYPNGPLEHSWYDVGSTNDFGGLVWYMFPGTAAAKYNVVVSAVVDFRART